MSRNAKRKGTAFESSIAAYMTVRLGRTVERIAAGRALDAGDLSGVYSAEGVPVSVECKAAHRMDIGGWLRQATGAAPRRGTRVAVVVHKRWGRAAPGDQYVTMSLAALCDLLTGTGRLRPVPTPSGSVCPVCGVPAEPDARCSCGAYLWGAPCPGKV